MLPPPDQMAPQVREMVRYWRSIHRREGLPGFKQIDPTAIPALLPHVWIIDVERAPYRFRFRLVGEAVIYSVPRLPGISLSGDDPPSGEYGNLPMLRRGMYLHELHKGPPPPRMMDGFVAAIERHEPDWYKGEPLTAHTRWIRSLERVALPLATDGVTVDCILNLSVYDKRG